MQQPQTVMREHPLRETDQFDKEERRRKFRKAVNAIPAADLAWLRQTGIDRGGHVDGLIGQFGPMTSREVGLVMDIARQRVDQITGQVLLRFRRNRTLRELAE